MNSITTECPQNPKTRRIQKSYKISLISFGLIGFAAISVTLIKVENAAIGFPSGLKSAMANLQSDHVLTLHDGDSVPQVSKVKVPISHYATGQNPVIEVIDMSYGAAFYYPAVVKNGHAYFTLKAGNPQDTGRVFKVRGLVLPGNAKIRFEESYDVPLSGDELFSQLLLNRK